jgi:hypothetical protein
MLLEVYQRNASRAPARRPSGDWCSWIYHDSNRKDGFPASAYHEPVYRFARYIGRDRRVPLTLRMHAFPDDFYRFSPSAVSSFLEGLQDAKLCTLLLPPRIIGAGVKPMRAAR